MYHYIAYGLNICSELLLPELKTSSAMEADVVIQLGKVNWLPPDPCPSWKYFHFDDDTAYLYWDIVGKFLVRSGKEIIIELIEGVDEGVVRLPLLGAVLAMVLHQRQHLLLHGSAVAIQEHAVIFAGASGHGKSTMAATLYGRGHRLMADDVSAINLEKISRPMLIPGFPQIKLWPEAVTAALGDDPEALKRIHPDLEKRARPTANGFLQVPLPLERIYLLSEGASVHIKPLKPQEAIAQLIGNSFIPMLVGEKFIQSKGAGLHISQCAHLVKNVPIYTLERPRSLELLSDIAHLIEEDLAVPVQI
jgi:HPr Serine kinase C-terminal domain